MTIISRDDRRHSLFAFILFASVVFVCQSEAVAQTGGTATTGSASTQQSGEPAILNGEVLNVLTNQPVARALVQAGSQAVLTEHDGKFQFSDTAGSSATIRVTKPGYYGGPDPNPSGKRIIFGSTADPLKIYLYPEALITGTVTAPNGEPIPSVFVQAYRRSGDEAGFSWMMSGQSLSNSDGQFRIPLSAGDYVLETRYMADRPVRHKAVLPVIVPDTANSNGIVSQSALRLESGTEQHFDLRPDLRPIHEVHVQFDGGSASTFRQVEAHLANGIAFFPAARPGGAPGDLVVSLPTGSYTLTLATNEGDGASFAQTAINVGDSDMTGVILHAVRSLPMQVEVLVDSAVSSATSDNQPPSAQQLGLRFVRTDQNAPATNETIYLRAARGETPGFNFTPGRYRLFAQPQSNWFIESADVGGSDLLAEDFSVGPGGTPAALRIVVSDNTAGIKGTIKLDGAPASGCWVYLVAATRGVTPLVSATSGSDGTFSRSSIPPGSYRAVAFETRHTADFTDPDTLERLVPYMKSFTVAPGEVTTLDIDAIPTTELTH